MGRRLIYTRNHATGGILSGGTITYNGSAGYPAVTGTWLVPENLVSLTIECYGSGWAGFYSVNGTTGGDGGASGSYAKQVNYTFNKGDILSYYMLTYYLGHDKTKVYSGATTYCQADGAGETSRTDKGLAANSIGSTVTDGNVGSARNGYIGGKGADGPAPLSAVGGEGGNRGGGFQGTNPGSGGGGGSFYTLNNPGGICGKPRIILTWTYYK